MVMGIPFSSSSSLISNNTTAVNSNSYIYCFLLFICSVCIIYYLGNKGLFGISLSKMLNSNSYLVNLLCICILLLVLLLNVCTIIY